MEMDNQPQQPAGANNNYRSSGNDSDTMQKWIPTKNPASLVSYYASIFGLFPFLGLPASIVAVVFGIIALKKYKENPTPGAKGHAITGLVLGGIQMFIFLIFIVTLIYTSIS